MTETKTILQEVVSHTTNIISKYSEKVVYHDYKFAKRLNKNIRKIGAASALTPEEIETAEIIGWFYSASFGEINVTLNEKSLVTDIAQRSVETATNFFEKIEYPEDKQTEIISGLRQMEFPNQPNTEIEKVVSDALAADINAKKGRYNFRKAYEEFLLLGADITKLQWYEAMLQRMKDIQFYTDYGKKKLESRFNKIRKLIKAESKKLSKQKLVALKKELNVSGKEMKKLKKKLKKSSKQDMRGIQTLFRTTSKNHYTLREMVDRKANIMLTVNSIILSLIIGGVIGNPVAFKTSFQYIPVGILTITCILSIVFAVLSTRPNKTQGEFTEEEIRAKLGNLLYFGNFHKMHQRDYEWGFLQMLNDSDYLYGSMIRDIYFLGQTLEEKFGFIRKSLNIFLVGFISTVVTFAIIEIVFH